MFTPGTYPATRSSARTSAPSARRTCSSRVAAFSAGVRVAVAVDASSARVRPSPDSSTSNSGSLIDTPPVGNRTPSVRSSGALLLRRDVGTQELALGQVLLLGDLPGGLDEDPVLFLDGERGVVVGAEVGVDDGLVLADRLGRALGDDP